MNSISKIYHLFRLYLAAIVIAAITTLSSCGNHDKQDDDQTGNDPEITITIPGSDNSPVGGDNNNLGTVSDDVGFRIDGGEADIEKIEVKLDGKIYSKLSEPPYDVVVNTGTLTDGQHTLAVVVTLTNGKQISTRATFTVQNTLVEITAPADILSLYPDYNPRGFVFLSDEAGKTLAVKQYQAGETFKMTAPGFKGNSFYLTEVIAYDAGINSKVITYSQVSRNGKWKLTSDVGGGEWLPERRDKTTVGSAHLEFINTPVERPEGGYRLAGNGLWDNEYDLYQPLDIHLSSNTSPLYITKGDVMNGEHTHYTLIPSVTVGTTRQIDVSQVSTPLTEEVITSSFDRLNMNVKGLPAENNFNNDIRVGWIDPASHQGNTYKLYYPGQAFPAYFYEVTNFGERWLDFGNFTRGDYDLTPIDANFDITLDLSKRKVSGSATGKLDVFYVTVRGEYTIWRVLGQPGDNRSLVVPEVPEVLKDILSTFPAHDTFAFSHVLDIKTIESYAGFVDYIRSSADGFNDAFVLGAEFKYRQKQILEERD